MVDFASSLGPCALVGKSIVGKSIGMGNMGIDTLVVVGHYGYVGCSRYEVVDGGLQFEEGKSNHSQSMVDSALAFVVVVGGVVVVMVVVMLVVVVGLVGFVVLVVAVVQQELEVGIELVLG